MNSCILRSRPSNLSLPIGWLPGCHQIGSWLVGSLTKNLSLGERPVCLPVSAVSAPVETIEASLRRIACSYRAAALRLRRSTATLSVIAIAAKDRELPGAQAYAIRERRELARRRCLPVT